MYISLYYGQLIDELTEVQNELKKLPESDQNLEMFSKSEGHLEDISLLNHKLCYDPDFIASRSDHILLCVNAELFLTSFKNQDCKDGQREEVPWRLLLQSLRT